VGRRGFIHGWSGPSPRRRPGLDPGKHGPPHGGPLALFGGPRFFHEREQLFMRVTLALVEGERPFVRDAAPSVRRTALPHRSAATLQAKGAPLPSVGCSSPLVGCSSRSEKRKRRPEHGSASARESSSSSRGPLPPKRKTRQPAQGPLSSEEETRASCEGPGPSRGGHVRSAQRERRSAWRTALLPIKASRSLRRRRARPRG
jgi:hypothetical protein